MRQTATDSAGLLRRWGSREEGLTQEEARQRLGEQGPNALKEKEKPSWLWRVWQQIKDPMVLVLIAAAAVSGALGEVADTVIILAVVVLNTVIGLVQQQRAERAIEALRNMSARQARVIREGVLRLVPAQDLVTGDIVELEAGDLVPADLALLTTASLQIEEASLTGESVPAEKDAAAAVEENCPLGDRVNQAFNGTSVTYGRGRGVVCATGMGTQMGRIAELINTSDDEQTPLQRQLAQIGKVLTAVVTGVCALIFVVGVLRTGGFPLDNTLHAFLTSISLAVAAIPEGLPAVVTIVMALGVTRMARRRAIIKHLPAVETLGCAQIICSDKTGTLTQNRMTVREVYVDGVLVPEERCADQPGGRLLCQALYLCNDASVTGKGEVGDPTETALKRFVQARLGEDPFPGLPRVEEMPFDSQRKMMTTVHQTPEGPRVFTKGAPDALLIHCDKTAESGEVRPLTEEDRERILAANRAMAGQALRVLAAATKPRDGGEPESGLVFIGLVGMMDPPRPEVYGAIDKCRSAGIVPVMITGDHRDTAVAIGREVGILREGDQAVLGSALDAMDEETLDGNLDSIRVYARVSPEHKVRIVEAFRRRGSVVAMTGDGVNDAPALKIADIGIGMGITGTDVAKGVADMLLADDNFATIVDAVEEGRVIYHNIRKAVQFLLASNMSEVLALFTATLLLPPGVRLLSPVHILWINLVTDSLPAIGLGVDAAEPGIMEEPPRRAGEKFFSRGLTARILLHGALLAVLTLAAYFVGYGVSPAAGTTMAFITLSLAEIAYAYAMKQSRSPLFSRSAFNNRVLNLSAGLPLVLLAVIMAVPVIRMWFSVVPLSPAQWGACVGLSLVVLPVLELARRLTAAQARK